MNKLLGSICLAMFLVWGTVACNQEDKCQGVVCEKASECWGDVLVEYTGACRAEDGKCAFIPREKACPNGCAAGRCLNTARVCHDDGNAQGPPCREAIETASDFEQLAVGSGWTMGTKFMLPARDDQTLLPLVFQNSKRYPLHICFLCCVFPEKFGACTCEEKSCRDLTQLTPQKYMDLIMRRDRRSYFAGALQRLYDEREGPIYGFGVWTEPGNPAELLEMQEVKQIYDYLRAFFLPEKLVYLPALSDPQAVAKARGWVNPPFPVYLAEDQVRVEAYIAGVAYGWVRLFSLEELQEALEEGSLSFRDIVVVNRVPFDIEAVIGGLVTGERQWELSHVNVRLSRRGTPNLFVKDCLQELAGWKGKLVRLEVENFTSGVDDVYRLRQATTEEAEKFWAEHRPKLGSAPPIERDFREFPLLESLSLGEATINRLGGKAANLARLYTFLPASYRVQAFAIPFAWFEDFMEGCEIEVWWKEPAERTNIRHYVELLEKDERINQDAGFRRQVLSDLRARMEKGCPLDGKLVEMLARRIEEVFGSSTVRVRFRSSSNVEDALEFSGAGLYNSTTVCAADSLDGDLQGPSRCDLSQDQERSIERGLRVVWASLYNDRAWEERDWYQIPQGQASMAIMVSEAFPNESANGVAFTGNPQQSSDDRYLVNAQVGDEAVVGNDPRLVPERDFLVMDPTTGRVQKIVRDRSSSLSPPGGRVLSDGQLTALGELLFFIDRNYPVDDEGFGREKILLDLEFKFTRAGELKIKQIRPFLDKCHRVVCDRPPQPFCRDENTLVEYYPTGSCDSVSGQCRYQEKVTVCDNGCRENSCF